MHDIKVELSLSSLKKKKKEKKAEVSLKGLMVFIIYKLNVVYKNTRTTKKGIKFFRKIMEN